MKKIPLIAGKEIRGLFASPVAYVVLMGFLVLGGWFFFNLLFRFNRLAAVYAGLQSEQGAGLNLNEHLIAPLLNNLVVVMLILIPVITMRSFAEEKKNGTYELLLTSPLTVTEIVLGKYLGSLAFVVVMISLTATYPIILMVYGDPEVGVLVAGYLGLLLMSAVFVAVGCFTSSLTENQIIAAVSCFVVLLLLYALSWPADTAGVALGPLLKYLSVLEHFGPMTRGVIDTADLFYLLSLVLVGLFLTHRSVEASR
jgi:ABC-2 type transport system permease protein